MSDQPRPYRLRYLSGGQEYRVVLAHSAADALAQAEVYAKYDDHGVLMEIRPLLDGECEACAGRVDACNVCEECHRDLGQRLEKLRGGRHL